jgi:hypothetical protein
VKKEGMCSVEHVIGIYGDFNFENINHAGKELFSSPV